MTEEWKALDAKKKKKYEDLAIKEKDRYTKEMEKAGLGKKPKDEDTGPKKPQTAYIIFSNERRETLRKE
jgi:hypothetical protein